MNIVLQERRRSRRGHFAGCSRTPRRRSPASPQRASSRLPGDRFGVALALFGGFFLYIGASDLIPESYHAHPKFLTTVDDLGGRGGSLSGHRAWSAERQALSGGSAAAAGRRAAARCEHDARDRGPLNDREAARRRKHQPESAPSAGSALMSTPNVRVGRRVSANISSEYGSALDKQRDPAGRRQDRRSRERGAGLRHADRRDDDGADQRAERSGRSAVRRARFLAEDDVERPANARPRARKRCPAARQGLVPGSRAATTPASPSAASTIHRKSTARCEAAMATASGPVNSSATAMPSGMRRERRVEKENSSRPSRRRKSGCCASRAPSAAGATGARRPAA